MIFLTKSQPDTSLPTSGVPEIQHAFSKPSELDIVLEQLELENSEPTEAKPLPLVDLQWHT